MRITGFTLLGLAVAIALGSNVACSKSPSPQKQAAERMMEKALNQGTQGKTRVDLGGSGAVDLSGLPEALRYPGAKVLSHVSGAGPDSRGDTYIMQTDDTPAQVAARFKQNLAGWKRVNVMEAPQVVSMVFDSPDGGQQVSITAGTERRSGKTNMSVTLTRK